MPLEDLETFSPKQLHYLTTSHHDINLAYGSMRSGKNLLEAIRMMVYGKFEPYGYTHKPLAFCGVSTKAVYRIVLQDLFTAVGPGNWEYNRQDGSGRLYDREFYSFGFSKANSYEALRGLSLAGALSTEHLFCHPSFDDELQFRLSFKGAKLFLDTNPGGPAHPIKTGLIDNPKMADKLGVYHFLMDDNPFIQKNPDYKSRLLAKYPPGTLIHRRNILGEWAQAEGAILTTFGDHNICRRFELPLLFNKVYAVVDYGTQNDFHALLVGVVKQVSGPDHYYVIREFVHSGRDTGVQKTPSQYKDDLVELIGHYQIDGVLVDPSATYFIAELRQAGFDLVDVDNSVGPGIQTLLELFNAGLITINQDDCPVLCEQIPSWCWDEKARMNEKEVPIKKNDHGIDALRYLCHTLEHQPDSWDVWNQLGEDEFL